jgi:ADP-heptose:LPS heptosyltransferase
MLLEWLIFPTKINRLITLFTTPVAPMLANIRKIAILRANALGDFIFALPALTALRSAYPQAEIVLLARPWHQAFLINRPGPIDRVVVIPKGGIGKEFKHGQDSAELEAFFATMQQEQFDLAIQMHGGGRNSNPFTLSLGAKLTVGLRTPDALLLDRWVPYIYYQPEILRYLEVVSLVDATTSQLEPRITVTSDDLTAAQQVVPLVGADTRVPPLAVLHPGASDPRRWWSTAKFAAVGDALVAAGAHVVVTGVESERALVEAVVNQMQAKAENLCGQLSLKGLTGLLSRCSVVVSSDSDPLHLAAAVGAPTVGIYWCGNLITAGPVTRSRHRPAISWRLNCPICGVNCTRDSCNHSASFVDDVPVQEVINSALSFIS